MKNELLKSLDIRIINLCSIFNTQYLTLKKKKKKNIPQNSILSAFVICQFYLSIIIRNTSRIFLSKNCYRFFCIANDLAAKLPLSRILFDFVRIDSGLRRGFSRVESSNCDGAGDATSGFIRDFGGWAIRLGHLLRTSRICGCKCSRLVFD